MSSEETEFFNILGVGKNGTTLLGSLIDNHPQISTYPMEMKFVGHYFNTIQDKSFEGILNFLFYKSKVSLIKNLENWNEKEKELARVVVGNLSEINFDTKKFKKVVYDNITAEIKLEKNYKKIILFFHNCLDIYLKKKLAKKIVIQDGCVGLRYINEQLQIFKKIKFIVLVRNPLDVYVSFKNITFQFKFFRRFIGDFSKAEVLNTKKENLNYSIINKLYNRYSNDKNFFFLRYEDLVKEPEQMMRKITNFIGVNFEKTLLTPTIFGEPWLGNSTRIKKKEHIDDKEVNKYSKYLNKNEIDFLTFSNQDFFKNFNYKAYIRNYNITEAFIIIFKIYFQNIFDAKSTITINKMFLFKYIYCVVILNNIFLFKCFKYLIKKKY